jgi:nitric oxide reductase NorE protein
LNEAILSLPEPGVGAKTSPPGDLAIWFFIFAEMLAFGMLFVVYAFARSRNVALFNASQLELNRMAGAINTLVLITSSFFAVRAVSAIRQNRSVACTHWLMGTVLWGGVFVVIKLWEFQGKFASGISLETNPFFMYYLLLTSFHLMHVILGMVIFGFVIAKARRGGYSREDHVGVETSASFWHMVDLLWIILFPLVYVIR